MCKVTTIQHLRRNFRCTGIRLVCLITLTYIWQSVVALHFASGLILTNPYEGDAVGVK